MITSVVSKIKDLLKKDAYLLSLGVTVKRGRPPMRDYADPVIYVFPETKSKERAAIGRQVYNHLMFINIVVIASSLDSDISDSKVEAIIDDELGHGIEPLLESDPTLGNSIDVLDVGDIDYDGFAGENMDQYTSLATIPVKCTKQRRS